jgi:glyoxylase-like metal-dependent hydrolase (beta-lactamase superfamily II)
MLLKPVLDYPFENIPEPGTVIAIQPGVLWLRMPLPMTLDHINLYLLEDDAGWWIVDTGLRGESTRAHWERIFANELGGKPVIGLICTHCHPDHIGQAGWLSERWKAPLWMTHGEYYVGRVFSTAGADGPVWEAMDFYARAGAGVEFLNGFKSRSKGFSGLVEPMPRSFHRLSHGDSLCIGGSSWEAVIGDGHSPEHLCLLNRERKLLLSGDQVIPIITSNVSVMAIEPEANPLRQWLDSHQRFLQLPDDVLVLPAHNTPFHGLHARLRYLISHHEDHLAALEEACVTPQTAQELLPVIFRRKLDGEQTGLALGECVAHLNLLMHRGSLRRELCDDGLYRYTSNDPSVAARALLARHDRDEDPVMVYEGEPI